MDLTEQTGILEWNASWECWNEAGITDMIVILRNRNRTRILEWITRIRNLIHWNSGTGHEFWNAILELGMLDGGTMERNRNIRLEC